MQSFKLLPTHDIKACLPLFKHLFRLFSECVTEFIAPLEYESSQCSTPLLYNFLYIISKQADIIKSKLENTLPFLWKKAYASKQDAVG